MDQSPKKNKMMKRRMRIMIMRMMIKVKMTMMMILSKKRKMKVMKTASMRVMKMIQWRNHQAILRNKAKVTNQQG